MNVNEQSYSGACTMTRGGRVNTCARGVKVLTKANGHNLCPNPYSIRRHFFDAYKGPHSGLQNVDAFICNHPPALCELYMPFNKSIMVMASGNVLCYSVHAF
jgi:hypothetical protein